MKVSNQIYQNPWLQNASKEPEIIDQNISVHKTLRMYISTSVSIKSTSLGCHEISNFTNRFKINFLLLMREIKWPCVFFLVRDSLQFNRVTLGRFSQRTTNEVR